MRRHNGIADPPENSGRAELLAGVVILHWEEQLPPALTKLWMILYKSIIVPKSSHRAVRNEKLRSPSRDEPGVVSLGRPLI